MAQFEIIQRNGMVHTVLVPDDLLEFTSQYRWHIIPQPPAFKAGRNASVIERRQGAPATINLHVDIYKELVRLDRKPALVGDETVDHIDHNPLNNLESNLRPATRAGQAHHQLRRRDNSSGQTGVVWSHIRHKWGVQVADNGKTQRLIAFVAPSPTAITEAGHIYDNFIRERRGEFAELNFPHCYGDRHSANCPIAELALVATHG